MVTSRVGNPCFFTGRRLDVIDKQDAGTPHHSTDDHAGLQLYDYRARTMDPVLGRFGQRDPIEYVDGMSRYQYAKSIPLDAVDPQGLKAYEACCAGKKYDVRAQCCEDNRVVDKATIWQCKRNIKDHPYVSVVFKHCYVCCDGPNSNCFSTTGGNQIGQEPLQIGDCTPQKVCPRQKNNKCKKQTMSKPYNRYTHNCCDWAHEHTQSDWWYPNLPPPYPPVLR
jgi:RHS repeat-associated protein